MTTASIAIGLAIWAYVSAGFAASVVWRRNDIADVLWGPGILIAAVIAVFASGHSVPSGPLAYLICGLISLWAIRIAWRIGNRFLSRPEEDARYAGWRRTWRAFYIRSYLQVFLLQGLLMVLVATVAAATAMYADGGRYHSIVAFAGCFVFALGLVIETVADIQLDTFSKTKTEKSEVLETGLWRYSRHPNYFGEVAAWWGLWIIAIAPAVAVPTVENLTIALVALISPVTITILILKVSGIPMLEAKYVGNTAYEHYQRRTSAFVTWFPKQAVSLLPPADASSAPAQSTRPSP
jgi:steroid 5-alpha reductase family enzyme